jgi:hypothetical protein
MRFADIKDMAGRTLMAFWHRAMLCDSNAMSYELQTTKRPCVQYDVLSLCKCGWDKSKMGFEF